MTDAIKIPDDPRTNYCVMIFMHTEDAHKCLNSPGGVRRLIADAFDSLQENYDNVPAKIEEEIDYTLDVYRTESDKDVTTRRIARLEQERDALALKVQRLGAPVSDEEWSVNHWVKSGGSMRGFIDAFIAARLNPPAKERP